MNNVIKYGAYLATLYYYIVARDRNVLYNSTNIKFELACKKDKQGQIFATPSLKQTKQQAIQ
jgi:hypothetical protein